MGADLIAFICKGPEKLDARKRRQAVEHTNEIIKAVEEAVDRDLSDKARKRVLRLTGLPDLDEVSRLYEKIPDGGAEVVVANLFAAWEGDFRDVNHRQDPDDPKQRILVAGEMSWGDEPEGGGYQALSVAVSLGLFEFFGIR